MEEITQLLTSLMPPPEELELWLRGGFQVLLLLSSAIFSGSETALFSLSRIDLQQLRNDRGPHSEKIHAMLDEPRRLIISILCGNELVNIASAANMAAILLLLFGTDDVGWLNIVIMVPLLLLVGEVTPKTIAVNFPLRFATAISARLLPRWMVLITPLREAVRLVADRLTTLIVGDAVSRENILQTDELRTLLEESEEIGVIDATERVLIDNVLEASETDINRIMTPGPRIRFLDAALPVPELIEAFRAFRHPRMPVYQGHWDNVIGFIHSEDVLRLVQGGGDISRVTLESILKPAHFVPPTKKVDEMFDYFQAHNTRIAIVLGEYGEVLGVVTVKDVLSFIFGEISGSMEAYDYESREGGNSFVVPGEMRLTEFYNLSNFDFEDPVMSTIGGFAFRLFDHLPREGDAVAHEGYEFIARGLAGLRISRVEVRKITTDERREEATERSEEESVEPLPVEALPEAEGATEAGEATAEDAGKRAVKEANDGKGEA